MKRMAREEEEMADIWKTKDFKGETGTEYAVNNSRRLPFGNRCGRRCSGLFWRTMGSFWVDMKNFFRY